MDGATYSDARKPEGDVERESPDRAPNQGGEAPDLDRASESEAGQSGEGADLNPQEAREDELLDEGLEETFPASDPVSAKHIT